MIVVALILFAVAALGGLVLAGKHLGNRELPLPLALVHGVVAAAGLVVLIIGAMAAGAGHALLLPLVLFVIAALGGFALLAGHLRGKRLSTPVVFMHAGIAVVAFLLLLAAAVKG